MLTHVALVNWKFVVEARAQN